MDLRRRSLRIEFDPIVRAAPSARVPDGGRRMTRARLLSILGGAFVLVLACLIYIFSSPGFAVTAVLVATAVAALVIAALAVVFLVGPWGPRVEDIGVALVSGVVFLMAAIMTQAASDVNNFRNSVLFTQDLHGFDPEGRSLQGMNFGGKNLSVANFGGADLREARLRQADLSTADLSDADFSDADLFYAQLHEADVHGADFSRANLRATKVGTLLPRNLVLATFHGATVSDETCWRIPRSGAEDAPRTTTPTPRGVETINFLLGAGLVADEPGRALGHVCTAADGEIPSQHPPTVRIFFCPDAPHLRTKEMMLARPGTSDLYCSTP
jgi:multisubunit Na+/H+ antiporter MnhB subunit